MILTRLSEFCALLRGNRPAKSPRREIFVDSLEPRVFYHAAPIPVDAPPAEVEGPPVAVQVEVMPAAAADPVDDAVGNHDHAADDDHDDPLLLVEGVTVQDIETLIDNGDSSNRIDITIAGDGYTADDLDEYNEELADVLENLFGSADRVAEANDGNFPYLRYAKFFNVHRVDVISAESGIDEIGGTERDTAFDGGQHPTSPRIAIGDYGLARRVSDAALNELGIDSDGYRALVFNTDAYVNVGAGGLAIYSQGQAHPGRLLVHEAAHSWHGLADEYGGNAGTVYDGSESGSVNVTADEDAPKWSDWDGYDQTGIGEIGSYEGGQYYDEGKYRPSEDSIMRADLDLGFNAVSREKVILDLYDIVDPLDDWADNSQIVSQNANFWVESIDHDIFQVEWSVNGEVIRTGHDEAFQYDFSGLDEGLHTVTARVFDEVILHAFSDNDDPHELDLVRRDLDKLQETVEWRVHVGDAPAISLTEANTVGKPATIRVIDNAAAAVEEVLVTVTVGEDEESIVLRKVEDGIFEGTVTSFFQSEVSIDGVLAYTSSDSTVTVAASYTSGSGAVVSAEGFLHDGPIDPAHHFAMSEGEGVDLEDLATIDDATIEGATWTTGHTGEAGDSALDFDGSDDTIELDSTLTTVLGGTASLSFWIRTEQTGGSDGWNSPAVAGVRTGSASSEFYWGWIDSTGRINASFSAFANRATSAEPINDGEWHHVVFTRDSMTGKVEVYVDTVYDDSATSSRGVYETEIHSLGRRENQNRAGDVTGGHYFDGALDDVRIYDYVVDAGDVEALGRREEIAVAVDDSLVTQADAAASEIEVTANDTIPIDSDWEIVNVIDPQHGTLVDLGDGKLSYSPDGDFTGTDQFTYTLSNGVGAATAMVRIDVRPPLDEDIPATDGLTGALERIDDLTEKSGEPVIFGGLARHGELSPDHSASPLFAATNNIDAGTSAVFFGRAEPGEKVVLRFVDAEKNVERIVLRANAEGIWKYAFDDIELDGILKLKVITGDTALRYRINPERLDSDDDDLAYSEYAGRLLRPVGETVDGVGSEKSRFEGRLGDLIGV